MPFIKFSIFLIIATFTLDICRAGFISIIEQDIQFPVVVHSYDLEYNFDGKHFSNSTSDKTINGNRTFDIPNGATNINLTMYGQDHFMEEKVQIFSQFYSSSVERCIFIDDFDWFQEFCPKLPAISPYSISVDRYHFLFPVYFHLSYQYNGFNFTEISRYYRSSMTKRNVHIAQIPDGAININFTIQRDTDVESNIHHHYRKKPFSVSKLYSVPVKKCFVVYSENQGDILWFEKPCIKLPTVNGNSISLDTYGCPQALRLTVTYQYEGSNFSETNYAEGQKMRTIEIPDLASHINVYVIIYKYGINQTHFGPPVQVFTKFYPSPGAKCIRINACGRNDIAYEKSCDATKHGYFISLNYSGDYYPYVVFEVTFTYNGMNITESSEEMLRKFSGFRQRSVLIPDEATNISLVIYKHHQEDMKYEIIFSETYSNPVKKCFQLDKSGLLTHHLSSGNLTDLDNDKKMAKFSC